MFKFISFAAVLAVARAGFIGSPAVTYNAAVSAPLAIHAPAIGSSQQSVVRSLDGNSAVSHYSKAVDTAFSSVRKYDTRVTNDAKYLSYDTAPALYHAPAPAVYTAAAPAAYAPASAYYAAASPIVKTVAPAYAPAPAYYAAPSPIVKTVAPAYASAPAYYAAPSPIVKTVAPAYAPASAYYAAPSPIVKTVTPVVAHTTFTGFGASYAF